MRKTMILLWGLLILLLPFSLAENSPTAENTMTLTADGESFSLQFDASPMYSMCEDGYAQCSFYGYNGSRLCEIFLVFPDSVQTGNVISAMSQAQAGDEESGVMMSISDQDTSVTSVAYQTAGAPYPEQSAYTLRFDSVYAFDGMISFSGTLEATLVEVDEQYNVLGTSHAVSGSFSCTLTIDAPSSAAPGAEFTVPPTIVTPPDAKKI